MDELEISGKQYISTRRAAKEHKYSADYIGQLVRGKKVVGQKVGRSWYVDADSLASYFFGEEKNKNSETQAVGKNSASERKEPVVKIERSTPTPALAHISLSPDDLKEEDDAQSTTIPLTKSTSIPIKKDINLKAVSERSNFVPITVKGKKGLTYLKDDAPLLPIAERKKSVTIDEKPILVSYEKSEPEISSASFPSVHKNTSSVFKLFLFLIGTGIFITSLMFGLSMWVSSKIIAGEGVPQIMQFSVGN